MKAGFVSESTPGERRVAMAPNAIPVFHKTGIELVMEAGAGLAAGFPDEEYREKGVQIVADCADVFRQAEVILQVRSPGDVLPLLRHGQTVIGFGEPLTAFDAVQ